MSLMVRIIFFRLTDEPCPKVLGYVCIPIWFTLNPAYFDLIANSAPINGLLELSFIFFTNFLFINLDPVEISLKLVLNNNLNTIL